MTYEIRKAASITVIYLFENPKKFSGVTGSQSGPDIYIYFAGFAQIQNGGRKQWIGQSYTLYILN